MIRVLARGIESEGVGKFCFLKGERGVWGGVGMEGRGKGKRAAVEVGPVGKMGS